MSISASSVIGGRHRSAETFARGVNGQRAQPAGEAGAARRGSDENVGKMHDRRGAIVTVHCGVIADRDAHCRPRRTRIIS